MEAAKEKSVTGSGDNFYFPNRRILSYIGLLILALSMPLPQSYCGNYDGHSVFGRVFAWIFTLPVVLNTLPVGNIMGNTVIFYFDAGGKQYPCPLHHEQGCRT